MIQISANSEIQKLVDGATKDKKIYAELLAAGEFEKSDYNPVMQQCHEENADILDKFLAKFG